MQKLYWWTPLEKQLLSDTKLVQPAPIYRQYIWEYISESSIISANFINDDVEFQNEKSLSLLLCTEIYCNAALTRKGRKNKKKFLLTSFSTVFPQLMSRIWVCWVCPIYWKFVHHVLNVQYVHMGQFLQDGENSCFVSFFS